MPPSTSYELYLDTAVSVAAEAAFLVDQLVGARTPTRKPDGTLVTQTDKALDDLIGSRLNAAFPTHAVLSEERITIYDPAVRYTWVIDPLDGTTNFARGLLIWGISLALLEEGVPVVGVVSFPLLHEVYTAIEGKGAFLNGDPIESARERSLDNQRFIMCCTRTAKSYLVDTPLKTRIFGSAAYHLLKVADASALAAIEATPKLWDLAAALLILSEAGGVYHPLGSGSAVFPVSPTAADYGARSFPLVAAANHDILRAVLSGVTELGRT